VSRARAHLEAGADHVCVQLREERSTDPALEGLRELAAGLLSL
jgi:2-methylisocitrate lyase-like PEP mutase family enzyme